MSYCDNCKKETSLWEMMWNGRYKHSDTLFTVVRRKMYVCPDCLVGMPSGHELNCIVAAKGKGKPTVNTITCAVRGCDNPATREWGGRPHCEGCMPPMCQASYKNPLTGHQHDNHANY